MSELFDDPDPTGGASEGGAPGGNLPELSVSELSGAVKRAIEGGFGRVRVRGEVGRVSRPRSGHVYLDLKDDRAVLASVIWKGVAGRLSVQPTEGDEVVATGKLTTFPGQSRYQLVIDDLALAGAGALLAKLERLKAALAAEGLFDAARKRRPPYLPEVIGVVTSPSGAVIRDILHRLSDRFPRRVLVWPVAVQGERCAPEVSAAIRGFDGLPEGHPLRPDVLIVARGGGSVEDLWGFNEEAVVRAAAGCSIPLISAVGHETDTTLIDFAADLRAPTPTAAAELAVPVRADLLAAVGELEQRRRRAAARLLAENGRRLRDLARALPRPEALLAERAQRLDAAALRLPRALSAFAVAKRAALGRGPAGRFSAALLSGALRARSDRLRDRGARLAPALGRVPRAEGRRFAELSARLRPERVSRETAARREALEAASRRLDRAGAAAARTAGERVARAGRLLETLSYQATLERGFAVVRADGALAPRRAAIPEGAALEIEFADGRLSVGAGAAAPSPDPAPDAAPRAAPPPPRRKRKPPEDDGQGSLL
ncbi:MAG: exodeoxyribonuclease VII large subunit [Pseudomonadota bacterium]